MNLSKIFIQLGDDGPTILKKHNVLVEIVELIIEHNSEQIERQLERESNSIMKRHGIE